MENQMSITIALLTMEATANNGYNIMQHGWDYPTHILTTFANELDKQTENWDWGTDLEKFDSWGQMIETLGKQLGEQIIEQNCPTAENGIRAFLKFHFPKKYLKKYHYNIPTSGNLYGGFDDGIVEAIDEIEARNIAIRLVDSGFGKINRLLESNHLPRFEYSTDEMTIVIEK
jgi:hypothetical protein